MEKWLAGILLPVFFLLSGCNGSNREQDEIRQLLEVRSQALNARNAAQYITTVSKRFSDKGRDFRAVKESVDRNFSDYEQIIYEAGVPVISVNRSSAESRRDYRMKVRVKGKELTLNGNEHLWLVREADGWKICAGI